MSLTVMSKPDRLVVGDAKVNAHNWSLIAPFQLSQPLVGSIKVSSHGHREHAFRRCAYSPAQTCNAVSANLRDCKAT